MSFGDQSFLRQCVWRYSLAALFLLLTLAFCRGEVALLRAPRLGPELLADAREEKAAIVAGILPQRPSGIVGSGGADSGSLIRRAKARGGGHELAATDEAPVSLQETSTGDAAGVKGRPHVFGLDWSASGYAVVLTYLTGIAVTVTVSGALQSTSERDSRSRNPVMQRTRPSLTRRLTFRVEGGDGADTGVSYEQTGYEYGWFGYLLLLCWVLIPLVGLFLLVMLTIANYDRGDPLQLKVRGVNSWESVAEPFIILTVACALVMALTADSSTSAIIYFMRPCPLQQASVVIIEGGGSFHAVAVFREGRADGVDRPASFDFMCFRYVYVEGEDRFRPVGELQDASGEALQEMMQQGGLSTAFAKKRQIQMGPNEVPVQVPSILMALYTEFHTKTYVYQGVCIWWTGFFGYINVAVVWFIFVLVSGAIKSLFISRRNLLRIQAMARNDMTVRVLRSGCLVDLPSRDLVPGDLVLVRPRTVMPCDCVLARGGAVMHEAMLTGEPLPITKETVNLETRRPKAGNTLYAGTEVLDASGSCVEELLSAEAMEEVEEGALAVVLAIGGSTMKANLIRMVLFPTTIKFDYDEDLVFVYKCLSVYVFFVFMFVRNYPYPFNTPENGTAVLVRGLFCVSQTINPLLGVAVAAGQSIYAGRLQARGISCLAPQRVPVAGCLDMLVLDKTGTITKDGMELHGFHLCTGTDFSPEGVVERDRLLSGALPPQVLHAFATCHKLSMINGEPIGNQVEIEMFKALSSWKIQTSSDGKRRFATSGTERLEVLRVLAFDHARMTSGAVVKLPSGEIRLFLKGAAAKIASLCCEAPADFVAVSDKLSAKCFYVLGLASRLLPAEDGLELVSRDDLETDLQAMGLLVFKNDLKPDSKAAIEAIAQGGVKSIVCTGDHLLTGASTAKEVGIISKNMKVFRADVAPDLVLSMHNLDTGETVEDLGYVLLMLSQDEAALVIEQSDWDRMQKLRVLDKLLPHIRVFGRMRPDGKVAVIQHLQRMGYYVGMCGDGGNDCGALRAAHAGLALSSADASIVAPFSSGADTSLFRFAELLRQGRACLATNVASFCWYLLSGLVITSMKMSLLTLSGAGFSDFEWMFNDIFLYLGVPWAMTACVASEKLSSFRPSSSLVSKRIKTIVFGQWVIYVVTWLSSLDLLRKQPFYVPWKPTEIGMEAERFEHLGDTFESEVACIQMCCHVLTAGLVLSYGSHHRGAMYKNWRLLLMYFLTVGALMVLLFSQSTGLNCIFRINCDGDTARRNNVPILSAYSNTRGRCFYGPQFLLWGNNTDYESRTRFLPQFVRQAHALPEGGGLPRCSPWWELAWHWKIPQELRHPAAVNNILSNSFRWQFVGLMSLSALAMHLWQWYTLGAKFDVEEAKEAKLRQKRQANSNEDEDPFSGGPRVTAATASAAHRSGGRESTRGATLTPPAAPVASSQAEPAAEAQRAPTPPPPPATVAAAAAAPAAEAEPAAEEAPPPPAAAAAAAAAPEAEVEAESAEERHKHEIEERKAAVQKLVSGGLSLVDDSHSRHSPRAHATTKNVADPVRDGAAEAETIRPSSQARDGVPAAAAGVQGFV